MNNNKQVKSCIPLGVRLLAIFFLFGATMCALTVVMLLSPGGALDSLWRLNPEAQPAFQSLGRWSIVLMLIVGSACASTAIGLAKRARWGWQLAIGVLLVNLIGDTINAVVRHDSRTLIGLPIGGALILYLISKSTRKWFVQDP